MEWTKTNAEKRLEELKIPDMPIMAIRPESVSVDSDWFQKYKKECRKFTRSLTDCVQELAMMNLNHQEFMDLLMGNDIPDNLSIRFRVPLEFGGKIDIENLFMCLTFPHSQNIDRFIIEQAGNKTIWLPNPARKIYFPIHSVITGTGGNAVADRQSQIAAAAVMASRRQP